MTVHAQAVKYRIFITTVNILHMWSYFVGRYIVRVGYWRRRLTLDYQFI